MQRIRKAFGFDTSDEIGVEIGLKSIGLSWVFGIVFLLVWSLYEVYNANINHAPMNVIPGIWLMVQVAIFGLMGFILWIRDKDCSLIVLKAIRISWIFGTVFLFVWFFLNVGDRELSSILLPMAFLWVFIQEASRVILEDKMRKGIDKEVSVIRPKNLDAVRVSWIFGIVFLLAWSLYEVYNARINFISASGVPIILLGVKVTVFGLLRFIIGNDKASAISIAWVFGMGLVIVVIPSLTDILALDIRSMMPILGMQQLAVYGLLYYIIPKTKDQEDSSIQQARVPILIVAMILVLINIYVFYAILPPYYTLF